MSATRMIVWECADGTGFNVLMEAPGLPHQWHWASRTDNFNKATVERFVQNCAGTDTIVLQRGGYRTEQGVLPDDWIVPETVIYYRGAQKWTPAGGLHG